MMKKIFNFKTISLFTLALSNVKLFAQNQVEVDRPVYEDLGVSPTILFIVMLTITIILLFALFTISKSAGTVLKQKAEKLRKTGLVIAFILLANHSFAADVSTPNDYIIDFPDTAFYAFLFLDILIVFLILYFAGVVKGALYDLHPIEKRETIFSRWNKKLTKAVEIEDEETIMLDHDYDGIKELDNDLPPWWKYGFYVTIIFAIIYLPYYHIFYPEKLQYGEYEQEMKEAELEIAAYKEAHPELINADNVTLMTAASDLKKGEEIFKTNCVACHGVDGGGGIGPNLTDEMWIYNGDIKGVFTTVSEGAKNGMVAWKNALSPDKIQAVSSYVLSLPPAQGGKEPQGENKFERP
jgi:mono/diheme cytochrome c family protein